MSNALDELRALCESRGRFMVNQTGRTLFLTSTLLATVKRSDAVSLYRDNGFVSTSDGGVLVRRTMEQAYGRKSDVVLRVVLSPTDRKAVTKLTAIVLTTIRFRSIAEATALADYLQCLEVSEVAA